MNFALNSIRTLALAAALACAGASALAQAPTASTAPGSTAANESGASGGYRMMGRHDPAQIQAWMAKREAALKQKLKITPAQEAEWSRFTAAMQAPANWGQRLTPEQRAEIDKLTTPERIDKMRTLRIQRKADRTAALDSRGAATKIFYAALNSEQQTAFDAEHKSMAQYHRNRHHHGGMHHKS